MHTIPSRLVRPFYLTLALGGTAVWGCGAQDLLTPDAASFDRSATAPTGEGGVLLTPRAIKGTYGPSCQRHPGENFALRLNDPTDNSIEVVMNQSVADCPLTITALQVQAGTQAQDFPVVPPIVLGLSYAAQPSAVNQPSPAGLAFYTNARLAGLDSEQYANNFRINLLYSSDAQGCGAVAPPAIYAEVTAMATGMSVPTPNYAIAFDTLQLVVDTNKVVQDSSSGNVILKYPAMQGQVGEEWSAFTDSTPCCQSVSFASIDTLYKTGHRVANGTIASPGDISIAWSNLGLKGLALPTAHTVIVKHTAAGGVYSYQLFQILFPGPPA